VQHRILQELAALAHAGLGVMLVTHDLRVLPGLADDVLLMHEGRIAERTTPERLRTGDVHSEAGLRLVKATRRVSAGVLG
jgi:ABC-type glutathione transport system ATPase component